MSMISEQIKEIKACAYAHEASGDAIYGTAATLYQAAETIEALSAKLAAANMEQPEGHYGGGWNVASERMPKEERRIDPETGYYGRSDDVLCSAYNEYGMLNEIWIDYTIDGEWQKHEYDKEEKIAWQPLPEPYHP